MPTDKTVNKLQEKRQQKGKHETGIGLNLKLNIMSSSVTASTLKDIESIVPQYTAQPLVKQVKFDENKFYNLLIFDTNTNTTEKSAELCQL